MLCFDCDGIQIPREIERVREDRLRRSTFLNRNSSALSTQHWQSGIKSTMSQLAVHLNTIGRFVYRAIHQNAIEVLFTVEWILNAEPSLAALDEPWIAFGAGQRVVLLKTRDWSLRTVTACSGFTFQARSFCRLPQVLRISRLRASL